MGGGQVYLSDLRLSSFVVEIEILPKPKIETYEREIQCDLISHDQAEIINRENGEPDDEFNISPPKIPHHVTQGIV
jgi:hypothetical protein